MPPCSRAYVALHMLIGDVEKLLRPGLPCNIARRNESNVEPKQVPFLGAPSRMPEKLTTVISSPVEWCSMVYFADGKTNELSKYGVGRYGRFAHLP